MSSEHFTLVRSLIPYIRPLKENNIGFPDNFCDVVTSQIWAVHKVVGAVPQCGEVEGFLHYWLKFYDINIDFTAHQFQSLKSVVIKVDGFEVLIGTDEYFTSLGYGFHPKGACLQQLISTSISLAMGEYGDCSVNACYLD